MRRAVTRRAPTRRAAMRRPGRPPRDRARAARPDRRPSSRPMTPQPPLEAARAIFAGREAWIVGGAVRDRLLGRATTDLDLAMPEDPKDAARGLARATGGAPFRLSGEF